MGTTSTLQAQGISPYQRGNMVVLWDFISPIWTATQALMARSTFAVMVAVIPLMMVSNRRVRLLGTLSRSAKLRVLDQCLDHDAFRVRQLIRIGWIFSI